MEEWYEETQDKDKIHQGEILLGLQIYNTIRPKKVDDNYCVEETKADCIVISQACDLDNKKIENVMLADLIDIDVFIRSLIEQNNDPLKTPKNKLKDATNYIVDMNKGFQPRFHLLKSKDSGNIMFNFKVIDFSRINTVLYDEILAFKQNTGVTITIKTPYREYIGQCFGNFYSKIGLPIGIKEKEIRTFIKSNISCSVK